MKPGMIMYLAKTSYGIPYWWP